MNRQAAHLRARQHSVVWDVRCAVVRLLPGDPEYPYTTMSIYHRQGYGHIPANVIETVYNQGKPEKMKDESA